MATLLVVAVLVAMVQFVQVVQASVKQSAARHRAIAEHAERVWRCNFQRLASQRTKCLAHLNAERSASAASAP